MNASSSAWVRPFSRPLILRRSSRLPFTPVSRPLSSASFLSASSTFLGSAGFSSEKTTLSLAG